MISVPYIGKTVYTVNAHTNLVDIWVCKDEFTADYHGKKERLCTLVQGKRMCILPKRCVFLDHLRALEIANKK